MIDEGKTKYKCVAIGVITYTEESCLQERRLMGLG